MTITRRARELVIVAMLLALPLLFLRANVKSPSELSFLDRAILRVSSPVQAALTWSVRGVGNVWRNYIALVGVADDNARLKTENARLAAEVERWKEEAKHGAELEKLLGLRSSQATLQTASARVVGVESSSFFRVVRIKIDAGEAVTLRAGLPVLAPAGVVGRLQRVYGRYADVLLATDPKSAIDVVVARTGGRGLVKGVPGDQRYRTRVEYLLRSDEVAEGDLVVTSGLGGVFPRNLPVGKVTKVAKKDFGLYQDAEVQPVVDFGKLTEVLVLIAPEEAPAVSGR